MSYTTFTANPAALIAQAGRAVNTFPSGLVRVDQTYLGLTSHATTHRATLAIGNNMPDGDSSPCIDGLKIFPEVQEKRREDGFTEYLVSAYGRSNATGKKTIEQDLTSVFTYYDVNDYITITTPGQNPIEKAEVNTVSNELIKGTVEKLIWTVSSPKNLQISIAPPTTPKVFDYSGNLLAQKTFLEVQTLNAVNSYIPQGYLIQGSTYNFPQNVVSQITSSYNISDIKKTNFGSFDEWIITYKATQPTLTFDGFWNAARPPLYATLGNLLGTNSADMLTRTLGPVYNLDSTSGGINENVVQNYVQLTSSFEPTVCGRAKIEMIGNTPQINNQFGYYDPGADGIGLNFKPFQRPAGGTHRVGNLPDHPIIQGVAEWGLSMTQHNDSFGPYSTYVYNLNNPITARYRWTVSNEFNQSTTFIKSVQYESETLVAP